TIALTNSAAPRSSAATIDAFAVRRACALAMATNSACGPNFSGEITKGAMKPGLTGALLFECLELFDRSMSFTELFQGAAIGIRIHFVKRRSIANIPDLTAYDIVRAGGVQTGKRNFMGADLNLVRLIGLDMPAPKGNRNAVVPSENSNHVMSRSPG